LQDPWLSRHCRIAFAGKQPRPRRSGRIVANNCSYDVRRDQQGRAWLAVMTPTRGQRLRLNLGTLPHELVPTSTYQRIAARAERDCARGKARNKLRAMRERHLTRAAAATAAGDTAMARAAAAKARRIERHNLGRKKLSAQRVRDRRGDERCGVSGGSRSS
jgi:hypothetical protein